MNLRSLKKLTLDDLIEFRDHGDMSKAPPEMVEYVKALTRVHGLYLRFDKYGSRDAVINHFVKFEGYSHYLASKIYDEAMEYFYMDRKTSVEAEVRRISELREKIIKTVLVSSSDPDTLLKASKELGDIQKQLNAAKSDKVEFPAELLEKPIKLYTSSAEDLGLPKINRFELGRFIDDLPEITEAQREKIKRDSQLLPVKIFADETE